MSAAKKRGFYSGKPLTLLSETIGDDGYVWYLAEYALASNGAIESSYIRSDFVQITGEVSGGADRLLPHFRAVGGLHLYLYG